MLIDYVLNKSVGISVKLKEYFPKTKEAINE